jgi:3-(3-hydroxy-phenyl)propionate hydroxylase
VQLFEAESKINDMPRSATTHAATLEMLADLGMVDEVIKRGLVEPLFRIWDRQTKRIVAEFDFGVLKDETPYPFAVQCEQHKLAGMALERLQSFPDVTVSFSTRVTAVEQFDDRVEIEVDDAAGTHKITGSHLIGADGGRSTARKAMDIEFEGYTHPERFMILTTTFDIGTMYPGCTRNYISDPDDWFSLFKVSGDERGPLWRVLSSTKPEQTDAELMNSEATERRLQKFLPKDKPYDIVHRNLYNVHQRVAASFQRPHILAGGRCPRQQSAAAGLTGIHVRWS